MTSLRARLMVAVVSLAACGLLLAGAVTYAEQRSFLYDKVDQQLRDGIVPAGHELEEPLKRGGDDAGGAPVYGTPPHAGFGLPPGGYVQKRYPDGRVTGHPIETLGQTVTAKPALPAKVPLGRPITVAGRKGAGTGYRALAQRDPGDASINVAAIPLRATDDSLDRLLAVEALVIGGVLVLLGIVAWIVVRVGLLPLDRMGHIAGAIAAGEFSHRVGSTDPRSAVGRLGIALNAMLDRLEQAFGAREASEDRLRRFVADASHELRTPLASIRGYAELFRIGAARDPADVEKAMQRIEDGAARMGTLVEDLLTLARLHEVADAPHERLDLPTIVRAAVDDGRATAPSRQIKTRIDEAATVVGDDHQLRQALDNLLRNAFVHTPDGTPVEVTLDRERDQVRLEIRDHGPGLPTSDHAALFERFWRSEGGRQRGKAGAGLGLTIVAAIVDAHEGHVHARNADGGGARFIVTLPAAD